MLPFSEQGQHVSVIYIRRSNGEVNAKLFTQTYNALEDMQAKVTEILQNGSDAVIVKLTRFSHFINAANAV